MTQCLTSGRKKKFWDSSNWSSNILSRQFSFKFMSSSKKITELIGTRLKVRKNLNPQNLSGKKMLKWRLLTSRKKISRLKKSKKFPGLKKMLRKKRPTPMFWRIRPNFSKRGKIPARCCPCMLCAIFSSEMILTAKFGLNILFAKSVSFSTTPSPWKICITSTRSAFGRARLKFPRRISATVSIGLTLPRWLKISSRRKIRRAIKCKNLGNNSTRINQTPRWKCVPPRKLCSVFSTTSPKKLTALLPTAWQTPRITTRKNCAWHSSRFKMPWACPTMFYIPR